MKTNNDIVNYCIKQVGRPYWYGCFGVKGSESVYQAKQKQYPAQYPPKKWTYTSFREGYGQKVHDCAGLVKGAIWSDSPDDPSPSYHSSQDYGANKFYECAEQKGKMDTFIDLPGILVFKGNDDKKDHIGVYVGNSKVIEAKGHAYGVVQSDLSDGWEYWGQCNLFVYDMNMVV